MIRYIPQYEPDNKDWTPVSAAIAIALLLLALSGVLMPMMGF